MKGGITVIELVAKLEAYKGTKSYNVSVMGDQKVFNASDTDECEPEFLAHVRSLFPNAVFETREIEASGRHKAFALERATTDGWYVTISQTIFTCPECGGKGCVPAPDASDREVLETVYCDCSAGAERPA